MAGHARAQRLKTTVVTADYFNLSAELFQTAENVLNRLIHLNKGVEQFQSRIEDAVFRG